MREKLTKNDIEKIEAEIHDRKVNKRPILIKEVKDAAAQGDRSENFEYYAAKKTKNQNESRIRYLQNMLNTAIIVDDSSKKNEVGINNTVTIKFLEDNSEEKFKLTTGIRSNSIEGRLDLESPLGKAILHKKVGDIVTVSAPNFSYKVEIISIDKSSDDNDAIRAF